MKIIGKKGIISILLSILLIGISTISHGATINLDVNGYINLPSSIVNGTGKITVSGVVGNSYKLYYQFVNTDATTLNKVASNVDNINKLAKEYNELAESGIATQEQLQIAETKYKNAVETYTNSIPKYSDSNWITTTGQIKLDTTSYTGVKYWVLWAKLITSSGETYYDAMIYTAEGTKQTQTTQTTETEKKDDKSTSWPDFSKAKIEFNGSTYATITLQISNIEGLQKDGYNYYYAISNSATELSAENIKKGAYIDSGIIKITNNDLKDYYPLSGDIYISLRAHNISTNEDKILINAKKVEKLPLNSLGNRIKATITSNHISITVNEFIGNNRKVKTKIGKVTDEALLKSIKNNESGWRQKLLDYAKKSTSINEQTLQMTNNIGGGSIPTNLNLVDGAYYFLYLVVDDENEKYYTVEDVYFTQGYNNAKTGSWLTTDYKFENGGEEEKTTETVKTNIQNDPTVANTILPKTGEGIAIIVAIVAIIGVAIFARSKYIKYRGI